MKTKLLIVSAIAVLILIFSLISTKAQEIGPGHRPQTGATLSQPSVPSDFCDNVNDVPRAECEALLTLYEATDGPEWSVSHRWVSDSQVCTWWGVACQGGRVQELDLRYNQLSGQLPAALGDLQHLQKLFLYSNNLSGGIPPELGLITSLQYLNIHSNQLSGGIPPALGLITSLQYLDLGSNRLSGQLPTTLGGLSHLQTLFLYDNDLSGGIPSELASLNSLEALVLVGNDLSGSVPPELGSNPNLRSVQLNYNQLSGPFPTSLLHASNLTSLGLSDNDFEGPLPEGIGALNKLRFFSIGNNNFTGALPEGIAALTNLVELKIGNNNFEGYLPDIGAMQELQHLEVNNNNLEGPLPRSIMGLQHLSYISIWGTDLCIPPFEDFVNWSNTQILDFYGKYYCPYQISGEIHDLGGVGIAGVSVLAGNGIEAITDGDGKYAFSELAADSYRLTPIKDRYVFSPGYHSVTFPLTNSNFDFVAIKDPVHIYLPLINSIPPDLFVERIIVTQAIQTVGNTVPLVQERPTIARVFAKTSGDEIVADVSVTLHAKRDGKPLDSLTKMPPSIPPNPERGDYESTVNFTLPDDWLRGDVTLSAIIDEQNIFAEGDETNNTYSVALHFNSVPILDVKLVPINFTQLPEQTFFPAHTEDTVTSWLMHVFPVSDVEVSMRTPIDFEGNLRLRDEMNRLMDTLADIKMLDGAPTQQVYYGIMPPGSSAVKDGLGFVGFRVSMGYGGYLYMSPFVCAHEIGHNFGVEHTSCAPGYNDPEYPYVDGSIGEYGLDVVDGRLWSPIAPDFAKDFMSYCEGPGWVSDYTYIKLYEDQIETGFSEQAEVRDGIFVRINLNNDATGEFLPTYWVRAPLTKETSDSVYTVELIDPHGFVLDTYSVPMLETADGALSERSIRAVLSQPQGRVNVIRLRKNGQLVAEKRIVVSPQKQVDYQLQIDADQSALLWESDGRPTLVRYALDDGRSWITLGIDVDATSISIPSELEISDPNHFEVIIGR